MALIPAPKRQRQVDLLRVWGLSGLHREFQENQGYYTGKPYLEKQKQTTKIPWVAYINFFFFFFFKSDIICYLKITFQKLLGKSGTWKVKFTLPASFLGICLWPWVWPWTAKVCMLICTRPKVLISGATLEFLLPFLIKSKTFSNYWQSFSKTM